MEHTEAHVHFMFAAAGHRRGALCINTRVGLSGITSVICIGKCKYIDTQSRTNLSFFIHTGHFIFFCMMKNITKKTKNKIKNETINYVVDLLTFVCTQQHVSEYGVHWNFFMSLCVSSLLFALVRAPPRFYGLLAVALITGNFTRCIFLSVRYCGCALECVPWRIYKRVYVNFFMSLCVIFALVRAPPRFFGLLAVASITDIDTLCCLLCLFMCAIWCVIFFLNCCRFQSAKNIKKVPHL